MQIQNWEKRENQQGRAGSQKLGEAELTQLNWQYLLKLPYIVRSRAKQYNIVIKGFMIVYKLCYCIPLKKGFPSASNNRGDIDK